MILIHYLLWNKLLVTGINKSFDRVAIDFTINVQHDNRTKRLWIVFHSCFHVSLDIRLLDFFSNQCLRFCIKRICGEYSLSQLFSSFSLLILLSENSCKVICINNWYLFIYLLYQMALLHNYLNENYNTQIVRGHRKGKIRK